MSFSIRSKLQKAISIIRHQLSLNPRHIFYTKAYSQEGEDLILRRIFGEKTDGFFVDVGAHHPFRLSNTYMFYQLGWRGINIDASPGTMELFYKARPGDINLELAIGTDLPPRTFYIFNEPALNTFDEELARSREGGPYNHAIIEERKVPTQSLATVLRKHLPSQTVIDFLTVDVEGLDLEVLISNDWTLYRPLYVLAEFYGVPLSKLPQERAYQFMLEQGYELFAKTANTVVLRDRHL